MVSEMFCAKQMLQMGGYSLVVCTKECVFVTEDGGIRELLSLVDENQWQGATAADRIVGKAAAMLFAKLESPKKSKPTPKPTIYLSYSSISTQYMV